MRKLFLTAIGVLFSLSLIAAPCSFTPPTCVHFNQGTIDLTTWLDADASPGGIWSGTGVSGTTLDLAAVGDTIVDITYTVGGCVETHTVNIVGIVSGGTVGRAPSVAFPGMPSPCTYTVSGSTNINLNNASETACILSGTSWNGGVNANNGGEIYIEDGATATIGTVNGRPDIYNEGTTSFGGFNMASGQKLNNWGTMNFTSNINFNGAGEFNNYVGGTITFTSSTTIANGTSLFNEDTVRFNSVFSTNSGTSIINDGYLLASSTFNPGGSFVNNGFVEAQGFINVNSGSTVTNNCGFVSQDGFNSTADMYNNGLIIIQGAGKSWQNSKVFTSGPESAITGDEFINSSTITGSGNFYFSGTKDTKNQGTFGVGTDDINFYDVDLPAGGFDVVGTVGPNVTFNAIAQPTVADIPSGCSDIIQGSDNTPPAINGEFCSEVDTIVETTLYETPVQICLDVLNVDGDTLILTEATAPQNGTNTLTGADDDTCFTYTPDPGFSGNDTTKIVVCDGNGGCDTALVVIEVMPPCSCPPGATIITSGTGLTVPVGVDACITSDANIAGSITVNGNLLISAGVNVNISAGGGVNINGNGIVEICTGGKLVMEGALSQNSNSQVILRDSAYMSIEGAYSVDATSTVYVEDYTIIEVCGTYTAFTITNHYNYIGDGVGDNWLINRAVGAGAGGNLTTSNNVNWVVMEGMANLNPGSAKYCGPLATGVSYCPGIWPVGLNPGVANCGENIFPQPDVSNTDPVANNDSNSIDEGDASVSHGDGSGNLVANDTDGDGDGLSVAEITYNASSNTTGTISTTYGTLTWNANGTYTFTLNNALPAINSLAVGASLTETFTYTVSDGNGGTDQGTLVITINGTNDDPLAGNDAYNVNEEATLNGDVSGNDSDVDTGDNLTYNTTPVTNVSNGTLSLNSDGSFTYTPATDFVGTDSFVYEVCDDNGGCDQATATITVDPVNDPVVVVDDAATTDEETAVDIDVVANDNDTKDGGNVDPTTVSITSAPSSGTTSIDPVTGVIEYTPATDFVGVVTFDYRVCDLGSPVPVTCDEATVTVTVDPVNDPVVVNDDTDDTDEESSVTTDVLANDNDTKDGGNLDLTTVSIFSNGSNGDAIPNPDGTITYTPDTDFVGVDTYTYEVCDLGDPLPATCDQATVTVTVNPVNDPVVVNDDAATTDEETAVAIDVAANDNDTKDGGNVDLTSVSIASAPSTGTTSIDPVTGVIEYTPAVDFVGVVTFDYRICDLGNPTPATCDVATVTVTVDPVNDPVVVNDDVAITDEEADVTTDVLVNDNDQKDGGALDLTSLVIASQATNGTATPNADGTISYTPNEDFVGIDSYIYRVCDLGNPLPATCDEAVVSITVNPVNDPVVVNDDVATTDEDNDVEVDVTSNDNDNKDGGSIDVTSVSVIGAPANGIYSVDPITGLITYSPNSNYNGNDTIIYRVCDLGNPMPATCGTAQLVITVAPINDEVVVTDDIDVTLEETEVITNVILNDNDDADGRGLDLTTLDVVSNGTNGNAFPNADGTITYTPTPGFSGIDTYTYEVCDLGTPLPATCGQATVTVTVTNEAPTANDDVATTDEDNAVVVDVIGNDTDPQPNIDPASVVVSNLDPAEATSSVDPATGEVTITPVDNFNGDITFNYTVCDLTNFCDQASVTVTVNPVNDNVVVEDDVDQTAEDTPVTTFVLANDNDDIDDGQLNLDSLSITVQPQNGTVTVDPITGSVEYTPAENFVGTDTYTYRVCDMGEPLPASCGEAVVTITVDPVNDDPEANDDVVTATEDEPQTGDVSTNDMDVDGDDLMFTITDSTTNGTIVLNPDGTFEYIPDPDFEGTDSFTYTVDDGNGGTDQATVTITVEPVNDDPVAVTDDFTINEDNALTGDVSLNDSDIDGDDLTFAVDTDPSNGTVVMNPDGTFEYVPNDDFTGSDSFAYTVSDGNGGTATTTVTVTVNPVNDNPVAVDDNVDTQEDTPVSGDVSTNDSDIDGDDLTFAVSGDPSNGTLTFNEDGTFTYTPNDGFNGRDVFSYIVSDGNGGSSTATVEITVGAVNDAPVATTVTSEVNEDEVLTINIAGFASDPENDPLVFSSSNIISASNGTVTIDANGDVVYTPNPNFNGEDSFTYEVCDASACDTSIIYVTVLPVNDDPTITDIFDNPTGVGVDTVYLTTISEIVVDTCITARDIDGDDLSLSGLAMLPANGVITGVPGEANDLCFGYLSQDGFVGMDTATINVCDGNGGCDQLVVIIEVLPGLTIYDGFSPNDDGFNDTWIIDGIEQYPNNSVEVFNRWGNLVYSAERYNNDDVVWDGRANEGALNVGDDILPDGTYFYIFDPGDGSKPFDGFVVLNK